MITPLGGEEKVQRKHNNDGNEEISGR